MKTATCAFCKTTYTEPEFLALEVVGETDDGMGGRLVQRNCPCRTREQGRGTFSMHYPGEPASVSESALDRLDRLARERRASLAAFLDEHRRDLPAVRMPSRHGWVLLVSRCPSEPGRWRLTRFEGREPVGHTTLNTWEGAVRIAVEDFAGILPQAVVI